MSPLREALIIARRLSTSDLDTLKMFLDVLTEDRKDDQSYEAGHDTGADDSQEPSLAQAMANIEKTTVKEKAAALFRARDAARKKKAYHLAKGKAHRKSKRYTVKNLDPTSLIGRTWVLLNQTAGEVTSTDLVECGDSTITRQQYSTSLNGLYKHFPNRIKREAVTIDGQRYLRYSIRSNSNSKTGAAP